MTSVAARSIAARCRGAAGFTLVEVLVALLIMAIVAAIGWQGVAAMVGARDASQKVAERALRLGAVVQQFESDLQAIYDGPSVPALDFDGTTLRIVRRGAGGVQVVAWSLREGVWRRWAAPAVTRATALQEAWIRAAQVPHDDAGQVKLLDGATGWAFHFYRGGAWSNAQSSGDVVAAPPPDPAASGATPAAPRTQLPAGVRLMIDLPEGRLTREVALLAAAA